MMKALISYGLRFGSVAGFVYYSSELGIWGDSAQAEQLLKQGKQLLAPYAATVKQKIPLSDIQLPTTECASRTAKNYWNKGVVKSIEFLGKLPSTVKGAGSNAFTYISQQLENANTEEKN
ncbi:unnamed protein product [Bemisia tabaci]|uniref:MICOS complex subunit MIC13 n=1 Tax=Bemisia tabaci TaxID=7038 RepID=A0A9P0ACE0_BEMTA|nr:unnamed protein product [Bemisia tabaci]